MGRGETIRRAGLRCHIHDVEFVSFPPVADWPPTRGCPVCVGAIREHVRREINRHARSLNLTDRTRLFEGLR
jgi:hypothetical protein